MFNYVAPSRYILPNLYLSVVDIANPNLLGCGCRTWISLDIALFYEDSASHPLLWAGGVDTICQTAVTAPPFVGCVV